MKKIIFLMVTMAFVTSCAKEENSFVSNDSASSRAKSSRLSGKLDVSNYSSAERGTQRSNLTVKLASLNGKEVEKTSELNPNTLYKLNLESIGANKIELRSAFGFEVLEIVENTNRGNYSATYTIKTKSDVTEPLFVSFLPLITSRDRVVQREQAQNFFLTEL